MYYEKAKALKRNQLVVKEYYNKSRCKDLGTEELIEARCPEIKELAEEFSDIINAIDKEGDEIVSSF